MNWKIIQPLMLPGTLCCGWQIIVLVIGILIGRGYRVKFERP